MNEMDSDEDNPLGNNMFQEPQGITHLKLGMIPYFRFAEVNFKIVLRLHDLGKFRDIPPCNGLH